MNDPFIYATFEYNLDEWDNVPPVIPRFSFYIQNCLSRCIEFSKEVHERQTTAQLRDEMYDQLEQKQMAIDDEAKSRVEEEFRAKAEEKNLQKQIDNVILVREEKKKEDYNKGQQDMKDGSFLNLNSNFN